MPQGWPNRMPQGWPTEDTPMLKFDERYQRVKQFSKEGVVKLYSYMSRGIYRSEHLCGLTGYRTFGDMISEEINVI